MNLFAETDYRIILSQLIHEKKSVDYRFTQEILATATGIQKTYLSKILNGVVHPSTDQLFELIDFFGLTSEQSAYLMLLLEHARTAKLRRKKILKRQIEATQDRHRDTKEHLKAQFKTPELTSEQMHRYYLDPFATVFHIALTQPEFGGDPKAVQKHLHLSDWQTAEITALLESLQLVERHPQKDRLRVIQDHLHLEGKSEFATPYHVLFRLASAFQLLKTPKEERFSFSVTFSADEQTKGRIHDQFLKFLKSIEPMVKEAESRQTYQLNFDLLPWRY